MSKKHFYKMTTGDNGVFVVTRWQYCAYYTTINNGEHDGDQFCCFDDPEQQHDGACWLAGINVRHGSVRLGLTESNA